MKTENNLELTEKFEKTTRVYNIGFFSKYAVEKMSCSIFSCCSEKYVIPQLCTPRWFLPRYFMTSFFLLWSFDLLPFDQKHGEKERFVTSTSQYQIFVEKFVQVPKKVRIKMADLAGP